MITVEVLNQKYKTENQKWDFSLFENWLKKHGILDEVIRPALELSLARFSIDTLPEKHHDFDREVLSIAQDLSKKSRASMAIAIEEDLNKRLNTVISLKPEPILGSKLSKIWKVIKGQI